MVLSRAGYFLYRAGWVISGVLLFDFPPTIFAYSGFVARLTNIDEAVEIGFLCTAIACLSWLGGRATAYVLARITTVRATRIRKLQHLPSDSYTPFVHQLPIRHIALGSIALLFLDALMVAMCAVVLVG